MKTVYLDNSATTPVCPQAARAALTMMTEQYGNPSSLHSLGAAAEQEMKKARERVAALIGCRTDTLVFTSGGTEANNLALFGAAQAKQRTGRHIVTSAVEHPSVAEACAELERQGFDITRLLPDASGQITPEQVASACRTDTVLVSLMTVNNEVGTRFALESLIPAIRRAAPQALIHSDAVQAAGKLPLNVERLDVDLLSLSAHKLHGPKGCGALYIRKGVRILPRAFGGGQERGLRPGTEATPLIAAFGAAAEALPTPAEQQRLYARLRDQLTEGLRQVNGASVISPDDAVPYIICLAVPGIRSETMLHFLADKGVYISSGSACSKGKRSHVLSALKLPADVIDSALRVSFSHINTEEDVSRFLDALSQAAASLVRRK